MSKLPRRLHLRDLIIAAENYFELKRGDILKQDRHKHIVGPRRMVIFLARSWLDLSYPYTGRAMNRDHTTILHHYQEMVRELRANPSGLAKVRQFLRFALKQVGQELSNEEFRARMEIALNSRVQREVEVVEGASA